MDKHIVTPEHVALWDAINNFAQAHNTERRMQVVPWIEDAIRQLLADRDAEIERLKHRGTRIGEKELAAENDKLRAEIERLNHELRETRIDAAEDAVLVAERYAEIERLRADLVWSVREDCRLVGRYVWQVASGYIECDGTPESIYRAVREARDGR